MAIPACFEFVDEILCDSDDKFVPLAIARGLPPKDAVKTYSEGGVLRLSVWIYLGVNSQYADACARLEELQTRGAVSARSTDVEDGASVQQRNNLERPLNSTLRLRCCVPLSRHFSFLLLFLLSSLFGARPAVLASLGGTPP